MVIAAPTSLNAGGVYFYRVQQPIEYLKSKGHTIKPLPHITDPKNMLPNLIGVDVLFVCSPYGKGMREFMLEVCKLNAQITLMLNAGIPKEELIKQSIPDHPIKIWVDFDDDILTVSPWNNAYLNTGRKEIMFPNPLDNNRLHYLWQEGAKYHTTSGEVKEFHIKANRRNVAYQLDMIKMADMITTPSVKLAKRLFRLSNRTVPVRYIPNVVEMKPFDGTKIPKSQDEIRLIWTLSASHFPDWTEAYKALGEVMMENPNLTLHTVGEEFAAKRYIPRSRWVHHKWEPNIPDYYKLLQSIDADIGIAYVTDMTYNQYKSPLKAVEYGNLGIPTIASSCLYGEYLDIPGSKVVNIDIEEFKTNLRNCINIKGKGTSIKLEEYTMQRVGDKLERDLMTLIKE